MPGLSFLILPGTEVCLLMKYAWYLSLPLALALAPATQGQIFKAGEYGVLSISTDFAYSFSFGDTTLTASAPENITGSVSSAGTDAALGAFVEFSLTADAGSFVIKYFNESDAFVFERRPAAGEELGMEWPRFDGLGAITNRTKCLGWSSNYFFPGSTSSSLEQCGDNGPLFIAVEPAAAGTTAEWVPRPTLGLSPLTNFTANGLIPLKGAKFPVVGVTASSVGSKWKTAALLLARPGLLRATRGLGALLRQVHATTRSRGVGVTALSYWADNQAGYSWWSAGDDQMIWGQPEAIYTSLKAGYDAADIPITHWSVVFVCVSLFCFGGKLVAKVAAVPS